MERQEAEGARLRNELGLLAQRARAALAGEGTKQVAKPSSARSKQKDDSDAQMQDALQKIEWYRAEIKRLRQELEGRERLNLAGGREDRDPMELLNLIAERRAVLKELSKESKGLDRIAEAQRRAEAAQSAMSPEVEERLRKLQEEVR